MSPEQPPVGEHQSNGTAEEAGRTVRDPARVLEIQLQLKIGREIEADEPVMSWLIRWAAMSVSRFLVGKDGKTPRRCPDKSQQGSYKVLQPLTTAQQHLQTDVAAVMLTECRNLLPTQAPDENTIFQSA